ncbi:MAG: thioredoxin-disulfide reductase [Elusimicrobiota bacterium]
MEKLSDILIIGAGPSGLTAGIYGARGGYKTTILTGSLAGGQLLYTSEIENFPGFENPISGYDLMNRMINQAKRLGVIMADEQATAIDASKNPFQITAGEKIYYAKTIIIATGASAKWLGLESEKKFRGKGISSCATCDGFFYKNKTVCVIGGGDTACEDAVFLTKFASKVYLIHRRDKFRASYLAQKKVLSNPKIEVIYNHIPEDFIGDEKLKGIKIKNVNTGEMREIPVDGAFVAIGHHPNTKIFSNIIKLDDQGYIIVDSNYETSAKGIFACGDVCDPKYKQAIAAAGIGCMAAMNAIKYLESLE